MKKSVIGISAVNKFGGSTIDNEDSTKVNMKEDPISKSLDKRTKDGKVRPEAVREVGAKPKEVKVFSLKMTGEHSNMAVMVKRDKSGGRPSTAATSRPSTAATNRPLTAATRPSTAASEPVDKTPCSI